MIGSTSGPSLTLSGSLPLVNTVLAHLTDTLQSGTDVVHIVAADSSGNTAVRDVGVQISSVGGVIRLAAATQRRTARRLRAAARGSGILVVGGVQSALVVPGNLDIGAGGINALLAALAPSAYSTASLTIGGTLRGPERRHRVFHRISWRRRDHDRQRRCDQGRRDPHGLRRQRDRQNNGTIEAAADQTLGLQRLTVTNALSGTGTLIIDRRRHVDR